MEIENLTTAYRSYRTERLSLYWTIFRFKTASPKSTKQAVQMIGVVFCGLAIVLLCPKENLNVVGIMNIVPVGIATI